MKSLYVILFLLFTMSACVPSGDVASTSNNSGSLQLTTSPSFLTMKQDSEARITISGGVPPYEANSADQTYGTTFLANGSDIASIFSKSQTGNFGVIIRDQEGNQLIVNVDITDGFKVFPTSRQIYAGRKIQITPLEGDLINYQYTLLQGGDHSEIDENGLLKINHSAPDNTLIVVEIQNTSTNEKENSFIYVRETLDSENITMSLGYNHTCLAKTNVNTSSSNLQCWGNRAYGALGESEGLVASAPATEAVTTKITTSLATQYPIGLHLSGNVGCATFLNGPYSSSKKAQQLKCWGSGPGSPNSAAGLYQNTMGSNLTSYIFQGDSSGLYIHKMSSGLEFQCAILSSIENNAILGTGDHDGEVRCWGNGTTSNGAIVYAERNSTGILGLNNGIQYSLTNAVKNDNSTSSFSYTASGGSREIPKFPNYVHSLNLATDPSLALSYTKQDYEDNFINNKIIAKDISSGASHSCVIRNDGAQTDQITCWGSNGYRQVSNGSTAHAYGGNMFYTTNDKNRLTEENNTFSLLASTPKKVFAGMYHNCAITNSGRLYCWGNNSYKQVHTTSGTSSFAPSNMVNTLFFDVSNSEEFVIDGSAGIHHTCVIVNSDINATQGRVVCFGNNTYGQKGLGVFGGSTSKPSNGEYVDLGNLVHGNGSNTPYEAVKLASSQFATCALLEKSPGDSGHSVKCWGRNHINQLGYGDNINRATASDAEGFTIGDGQVLDISANFLGGFCALKLNGDVKCWGSLSNGALGQENFQLGNTQPEEPLQNLGNTDLKTFGSEIKEIVASSNSSCALFKSGDAHCWGRNDNNTLGVGNGVNIGDDSNELDGVKTLTAGVNIKLKQIGLTRYNGCAINENDEVLCWGDSSDGINANGDGQTSSTISHIMSKADNTPPLPALSGKQAVQLTYGSHHICGLFNNSFGNQEVFCWGDNSYGQLGVFTNSRYVGRHTDELYNLAPTTTFINHIATPLNLNLGSGDIIIKLTAGVQHTCALVEKSGTKEENYVKCWGRNSTIGVGTANDPWVAGAPTSARWHGSGFITPKINFGGDNPVSILAGANHTCVLFDTEQVKCWGDSNLSGKLGWHATTGNIETPAPKGEGYVDLGPGRRATTLFSGLQADHTCAVLESDNDLDGRYDIKCWGNNNNGQLGVGTSYSTDINNGYQSLREDTSLLRYKVANP